MGRGKWWVPSGRSIGMGIGQGEVGLAREGRTGAGEVEARTGREQW